MARTNLASPPHPAQGSRLLPALLAAGLLAALAAGLILRLRGLGVPSLGHVEMYVPGLDLPPGISTPPPRIGFAEALEFHVHAEPHPVGWYMLMWSWTHLFGTTEWIVRLPSVIFGALVIGTVAALARQVYGAAAGVLAAGMAALDGFLIYWSQIAKMYMAGTFFCALSMVLLIALARAGGRRPWTEAAYVLTAVAAVQSTQLSWAVLGMQALWSVLVLRLSDRGAVVRLLQVQTLALILAAPAIEHALYNARHDAVETEPFRFIADYVTGGFLFVSSDWPVPPVSVGPFAAGLLLAGCAVLLLLGLTRRSTPAPATAGEAPPLPRRVLPAAALAVASLMAWLAASAVRRNAALLALSALPLAALFLPFLARIAQRHILDRIGPLRRAIAAADPWVLLLALVGLGAPLVLFAASAAVAILADRAFLVFVPALLAIMAGGATRPWGAPALRLAIPAATLAMFAASIPHHARIPPSPNDYKTLAALMRDRMEPGDLVFVRNKSWADTPLFYYLRDAAYVTEDYDAALAAAPAGRVWTITVSDMPGDWQEAVAALTPAETLEALRIRADLYLTAPQP